MGSVVHFMPRRGKGSRTLRAVETSASIIIFPGVRYERARATRQDSGERPERDNKSRTHELSPQR
ncbi:MAG: hypothetical protein ABS58_03360 [Mesorhizobium sp. SCN 65-20]|nr:MAG: hypothetical protein ABS58_03360 [Mesorhizobium sp. SCN 65-20]